MIHPLFIHLSAYCASILIVTGVHGADTSEKRRLAENTIKVTLIESSLPELTIPEKGAQLEIEHYIQWNVISTQTTMVMNAYKQAIIDAPIEWKVIVDDFVEKPDGIHGTFEIPYMFKHHGGGSGSSVRLEALFPNDQRPMLMKIMKHDIVRISGNFSFENNNTVLIKDAKLALEGH